MSDSKCAVCHCAVPAASTVPFFCSSCRLAETVACTGCADSDEKMGANVCVSCTAAVCTDCALVACAGRKGADLTEARTVCVRCSRLEECPTCWVHTCPVCACDCEEGDVLTKAAR